MYNRLVLPLVAASALAFACGPRSHSAAETPGPTVEAAKEAGAAVATDSAGTVAANLAITVGEQVEIAIEVANASTRRIELDFPSGQTHDIAVLDAAGREVWRWSDGRLFTSAVQNRMVGAGEVVTYSERWKPELPGGSYTVVATLTSSSHPVEVRKGIELR